MWRRGNNGGDNGDGGDIGPINPADPSIFIGTWKSQGVDPSITLTIGEKHSNDENWIYFKGKVECSVLSSGSIEINEPSIYENIAAASTEYGGQKITSLLVTSDQINISGLLTDSNTIRVAYLQMSNDEGFSCEFDEEESDEIITFNKQ